LNWFRFCGVLALVTFLFPASFAEGDSHSLLRAGKADAAITELNAHIEKNPSDADAFNLLCRVYYQLERWDDAIRAAEHSVALSPETSEYHQWLGRSYGRKAEASGPIGAFSLVRKVKNEFERAVALGDNNISAHADMAEFYIEAPGFMGGDKAKAKALGEFIMKSDPALAHYTFGHLEEKRGNKAKAEEEYKAAISSSNDLPRYWINLAAFYRHAGRISDMQSAVESSLNSSRKDNLALFDGATNLLKAGRNFPGAEQMLRRYLASNEPDEEAPVFQAHYLLGVLLEKQGSRQEASGEYRAALAIASRFRPAQDALTRFSR